MIITMIVLGVIVAVCFFVNIAFANGREMCIVASLLMILFTLLFSASLTQYRKEKDMKTYLSQTAIVLKWSDNFTIERLVHIKNGEITLDRYLPATIKKVSQ